MHDSFGASKLQATIDAQLQTFEEITNVIAHDQGVGICHSNAFTGVKFIHHARALPCRHCGRLFFRQSLPLHEVRCAHRAAMELTTCPFCGREFRRNELKDHAPQCARKRSSPLITPDTSCYLETQSGNCSTNVVQLCCEPPACCSLEASLGNQSWKGKENSCRSFVAKPSVRSRSLPSSAKNCHSSHVKNRTAGSKIPEVSLPNIPQGDPQHSSQLVVVPDDAREVSDLNLQFPSQHMEHQEDTSSVNLNSSQDLMLDISACAKSNHVMPPKSCNVGQNGFQDEILNISAFADDSHQSRRFDVMLGPRQKEVVQAKGGTPLQQLVALRQDVRNLCSQLCSSSTFK